MYRFYSFLAVALIVLAGLAFNVSYSTATNGTSVTSGTASERPARSERPTRSVAASASPSAEASDRTPRSPRGSATAVASPSARPDRSDRPNAPSVTPTATAEVRPDRSPRPTREAVTDLPVTGTGSTALAAQTQQATSQQICNAAFAKYAPIRYTWQTLDASLNRLGCNLGPNLVSAVPAGGICASTARVNWYYNQSLTEYQVRDRVVNSGCKSYEDGSYSR